MISRRKFISSAILAGGAAFLFSRSLGAQPRKETLFRPAYAKLEGKGKFAARIREAEGLLANCRLCPRMCGVNRLKGERGFCRAPLKPVIYSAHPHFGEERPIVGINGSGTIFFSNCNLRCVFCQNWPIAHEGRGEEISPEELASVMIRLQKIGCHNINLVTPTHVMPAILGAVRIALKKGLNLPIFYNTSGYENLEALAILNGIVDIYKPDMKYMDGDKAARYSAGAADYPEAAKGAVLEMHRQVGTLRLDSRGVAQRGLLIRHLVMPNGVAGTEKFVKWVAENLPKSTYINIMAQYRVEYKAFEHPEIARGITVKEFLEAMALAERQGLTNLDTNSLAVRDRHLRS